MTSPQDFVGHWNFEDSENFDAYMKEVGVGLVTRTMASKLKPTLDFTVDGDHWKIVSTSTFKTVVVEFDLSKEFEETTADGRKLNSVFTFENGKLIQIQKAKPGTSDKDSRFERFIENGKLVITMQSGDVKAKRVYVKGA